MKKKQIGLNKILVLLLLLSIFLTACTKTTDTNKKATSGEDISNEIVEPITVGLVAGSSTTEVFNVALKVLEDKGYKVETKIFNDFNSPNTAVNDGSLQYNFYQHLPFLNSFNESQGTDLVPIGDGVYTVNYGVFSNKIDNVDQIKDGMTVAIQNDNTNRRITLKMFENEGIIKLKEGVEMPTLLDIVDNPKNLKFMEMEETMIPAAFNDVDLACCSSSQWRASGNDTNDAIISKQDLESTLYLVTAPGNEDSPTSKLLQEALTSPEVKAFLEEKYKGVAAPVF